MDAILWLAAVVVLLVIEIACWALQRSGLPGVH